jgi:6-phosphogluconolactonase
MIRILNTSFDAAQAISALLFERAQEHKSKGTFFSIAVSGGNTPKLLFEILVKDYFDIFPWQVLRIFWVDERCVSPTHLESNYGMTNATFLSKVPISSENIFRMKGENIPAKEAKRYETLVMSELPIENGIPKFDFILLGMGDDGHTASIFPSQMELLTCKEFVTIGKHPDSGQNRITLTGRTILNANEIVFFITGASKSIVLGEIIRDTNCSRQYPAHFIYKNSRNKLFFYLDVLAASQLK